VFIDVQCTIMVPSCPYWNESQEDIFVIIKWIVSLFCLTGYYSFQYRFGHIIAICSPTWYFSRRLSQLAHTLPVTVKRTTWFRSRGQMTVKWFVHGLGVSQPHHWQTNALTYLSYQVSLKWIEVSKTDILKINIYEPFLLVMGQMTLPCKMTVQKLELTLDFYSLQSLQTHVW